MRVRSVVLPLVIVNVVIFLLQILLGQWFTDAFLLNANDWFLRPWILLTSAFLHGGVWHLAFNMYALFIFGPLIEQRIGPKRFLIVYLIAAVLAGFGSTFFYERALGASGAVMAVLGLAIVLLPHLRVLFFFFIPMSLRTAGIIFALLDLAGVFGYGVPGIANIAHLVGLAIGVGYGIYLIKQKKKHTRKFSGPRQTIELSKDDVDHYFKYGRI